ncbi:MAG: conjugal transfer protein TrbE, partial [Geminicoccaceae bacterium]
RLNNALRRLGSGWALFVEAERHPTTGYPDSTFPDPVSWLVDEERRGLFEDDGQLFESRYFITLLYLLPVERAGKAEKRLLVGKKTGADVDYDEALANFVSQTDRLFDLLGGIMPAFVPFDDAATLTYLHGTISTRRHPVVVPEVPFYLDGLLVDTPLTGGLAPKLGDCHLRTLTVRGLPSVTRPGLLDDLNHLAISYRWMTRFLPLDKDQATREITKLRRQWFAKRKGVVALLRETVFQQEAPLVDSDADNKVVDANLALQELGSDEVSFGYLTTTLTIWDADARKAEEKVKAIERVINGHGFVTIDETLNAVDAWLGSLPGHGYANVRQPLVSSLNLAHLIPMSAVWAGPAWNEHLDGPPLLLSKTTGSTPFRLVTHVGDVGHSLVVGPTGAGKSVLLALMALQFRRYPKSRVFMFDKGGSALAAVTGMGGQFYDLGEDESLAFQPLFLIDQEHERAWAAEWLGDVLAQEGVTLTPEIRDMVWSALCSLSGAPKDERTITGLAVLLQSQALQRALQPYMVDGPFGRLLDADEDRLGSGDVQCFEMEELMHTRQVVLPVLTYLFHCLEARFDGRPSLLILDEAWVFLDHPLFAGRIREWLKTLRKKNVAVVFATQSLSDIAESSIAPAIIESCPSRIFLPNDRAVEPQAKEIYQRFGLNDRQIEIIARATPTHDYYLQSRLGNRLFELGLGEAALAFCGASSKQDQALIRRLLEQHGEAGFADPYLRAKGLDWAAELIASYQPATAA